MDISGSFASGWRMENGGWRMEDGGWRMEDGPQGSGNGLVGDLAAEFVAAPAQDRRALAFGVAEHFFHQAGLAHPGFPLHQRQFALAPAGSLPPGDQGGVFVFSSGEWEVGRLGNW